MKRMRLVKKRGYTIQFKQMNRDHCLGLCDFDERTIYIDVLAHFVDTFIHEYLHVRHPELSETKIEAMTRRVRGRMSAKEIRQLAKLVCKEAIRN